MQLGVLGPLEVTRGGVQVPLPRAQERRLLAAFAIHAGESVSTDALVEELWPGEQPPQGNGDDRTHLGASNKAKGAQ